MGINGLTTFVAQRSEHSFDPYRLQNCYLVIDGNSVASQLYVREFSGSKRSRCAFGGDYDEYARAVKRFFSQLAGCLVKSIVVFDGGREPRKQRTHWKRLKGKINAALKTTPSHCSEANMPLLMVQVFQWIANHSGAIVAQCYFEADEEIAALSRSLCCPLLSYDSDFYIHAVPYYIPFPTLATKLTEAVYESQENSSRRFIERYLECRAFNVNTFLSRINAGEWRRKSGGDKRILQLEVLPLVAALMGNDYVNRKTFSSFLSQVQLPNKSNTTGKIAGLLEWLRLEESLDSAIEKVLNHAKKGRREYLERVIRQTVDIYVGNPSELLHQLNLSSVCDAKSSSIKTSGITGCVGLSCPDDNDKSLMDENESASEILGQSKIKEQIQDETEYSTEDTYDLAQLSLNEDSCSQSSQSHSDAEESDFEEEEGMDWSWKEKIKQLPSWFIKRYQQCELPPSFIDIMVRRKYLCPPQVEDHSQPHSHEISFPILRAILRLLTPENDEPLLCWTRVNRHAVSLSLEPLPKNPAWPLPENLLETRRNDLVIVLLQAMNLFSDDKNENKERNLAFNSLPSDWRLLALCLAYWIRFSPEKKINERHLITACFCSVVLRVVDVRAGPPGQKSKKVRKGKKMESIELKQQSESRTLKECEMEYEPTNTEKVNIPSRESTGHLKKVRQTLKQLLPLVSTEECITVAESGGLIFHMRQIDGGSKRQMFTGDQNIYRTRCPPFNISTVHAFSELQSILLHATHLNCLLGLPLMPFPLHSSFSGTLAYNAHYRTHTKSGSSRKILWQRLLGTSAPSLENVMEEFFICVNRIAYGKDVVESNFWCKKTPKKRNKKISNEKVQRSGDQNTRSSENKEKFFDVENKFSLLGSMN